MLRGLRQASHNRLGRIIMAIVLGLIAMSFVFWGIGDMLRSWSIRDMVRGYGPSTVIKIGPT